MSKMIKVAAAAAAIIAITMNGMCVQAHAHTALGVAHILKEEVTVTSEDEESSLNNESTRDDFEDVPTTSMIAVSNAKSKEFDPDKYGSNEITEATEEELNALIDKIIERRGLKYCPFKDKGYVLRMIEDEYGVSALCCLSIWTWESSFGTSSMARNKNNYGGIIGKSYSSIDEGMLAQGKLLSEKYIADGYISYSKIADRYCPGNTTWAGNVSSTAKKYAEILYNIINE